MKFPKNKPVRLKGKALEKLISAVWERDNYTCQGKDCAQLFPIDRPHHIIFKSQGGSDTMENLITLCRKCHSKAHGINVVGGFDGTIPF